MAPSRPSLSASKFPCGFLYSSEPALMRGDRPKKLPTVRDVAKAAGVSPMTVSRVLSQPQLVAPLTRGRGQEALRDLEYVADELVRPLGKSRRPFISILALNLATTPYSVDITFAI